MNRMTCVVLTGFAMLAACPLVLWAAQQARTSQAADLRSTPFSDSTSLKQLAAGTAVDVLARQGGWYQVKAGADQGWLRMSSLQFTEGQKPSGGGNDALGILQSGRSSSTEATASTGVRGLGEAQLASATPDMGAVAQMEKMSIAEADARQFAAQIPLKAAAVQDLPAGAK